MAILKPDTRRTWTAMVGVLSLACLAGCMIADALHHAPPKFAFSHRFHVQDQELECADCHGGVEKSDEPGMPRRATCMLCHSGIDAEKPDDRKVATLFEGDQYRAARAGHHSDEILFSHHSHATRGQECASCHAEVMKDEGAVASGGVEWQMSMDTCISCHTSGAGPVQSDCAACHQEIRAGVAPPSHNANWKRYHGSFVHAHTDQRSDQCKLCHTESSCTQCHSVELPANHNNYWRRRGHGLTASMDRDSCFTCHDSDSCRRCHEEIRPQSHVGMWGAPVDRHCLDCHEPLRGQSCGVCHSGTPSHDQATPLPADHNPGMNCRMCHGNGQPLPHKDNLQPCTSCHH